MWLCNNSFTLEFYSSVGVWHCKISVWFNCLMFSAAKQQLRVQREHKGEHKTSHCYFIYFVHKVNSESRLFSLYVVCLKSFHVALTVFHSQNFESVCVTESVPCMSSLLRLCAYTFFCFALNAYMCWALTNAERNKTTLQWQSQIESTYQLLFLWRSFKSS